MLGEETVIDACTMDYFGESTDGTEFVVSGEDQDHHFEGSKPMLIFCDGFKSITIVGKEISKPTNFTISISSHDSSKSVLKITLKIELSPCHPGFHYDHKIQRCVCYNDSDIVYCSGVTSSIKEATGLVKLVVNLLFPLVQITILILLVVKPLMDFITYHQLELISAAHTDLEVLVVL